MANILEATTTVGASSATEDMIALRNQIEQRLLANPDYRAFVALNRAIAEALGDEVHDVGAAAAAVKKKVTPITNGEIKDMTQTDAAEVILTKVLNAPAQTGTLVKALAAHGVTVGGDTPERANANLSSMLSKDKQKRFRAVRYNGRACWWVKTTYPGETFEP